MRSQTRSPDLDMGVVVMGANDEEECQDSLYRDVIRGGYVTLPCSVHIVNIGCSNNHSLKPGAVRQCYPGSPPGML